MKKKYIITTLVLMFLICILTPISGDDYGNYISTTGKLSESIDIAIHYYNVLEGRFIGRIIIMFTTYHKFLWNIITPLIFTLMLAALSKFIKNTSALIILLAGILLLNSDMFSQSYTWLAGSITYLYPTSLIIFYNIYIYYHQEKYKKIDYFILIPLSIIIPMFVENLGCAFVLGNFILLGYKYYKKIKIPKIHIITTTLSLLFLTIMILSPGSAQRSLTENITFNNLNLFEKIIYNIPNFNTYVFFKNSLMIIITIIPIIYYLIKKNKKIFIIFFSIIPILSIINNMYYTLPMKFEFLQNLSIINTQNKIYLVYWIIYTLLFIISINYIIKDKKEKHFIYFMLTLSLSSVGIMFILPTWGDRIVLFNTITLTFIGTILIDKIMPSKKLINKSFKLLYLLIFIYFLMCFISIFRINNYREKYIKKQLEEDKQIIEVVRNPFMYVWNNNPQSDYFIRTYKSYVSIPKEKDIEITELSYKKYIKIILGVE